MQKIRGNHVGCKRSVFFLENNSDNVVADVSLPLQLLTVCFAVGQKRGHVEHDLLILECLIHRVVACLAISCVQTAAETRMTVQFYSLPEQIQKLVKRLAVLLVREELLLSRLTLFHVNNAKFQVLIQRMIVKIAHKFKSLQINPKLIHFKYNNNNQNDSNAH